MESERTLAVGRDVTGRALFSRAAVSLGQLAFGWDSGTVVADSSLVPAQKPKPHLDFEAWWPGRHVDAGGPCTCTIYYRYRDKGCGFGLGWLGCEKEPEGHLPFDVEAED